MTALRIPLRRCNALIADGQDGYAVEMLLAQTLGSNDEAGAAVALQAAAKLDPTQSLAPVRPGRFSREKR